MSPTTLTWPEIIDRIFEEFYPVRNASPDWLGVPGISLQLTVDVLYPELGIAVWYNDAPGDKRRSDAAFAGVCADLCRQAGIVLIVVDGEVETQSRAWGAIQTALSASARRVAQQQGAREAKLDLLPRIASAKARCLQLLDSVSPPTPVRGKEPKQQSGRRPSPVWQPSREGWDLFASERIATLGSVAGSLFAILKQVLLLVIVLLAVNSASFLIASFLDLRGPMAYNYVPDTQVPLGEALAPYPDYLRHALRGDFGTMRLNELRGMLFAQSEMPILDLILSRLGRSLMLLGLAVLFAVVVGLVAGFLSVNYKTGRTNPLALILSLAGFSMPGFYVGIFIVYLMIWAAMNYGRGVFFLPTTGFGLDEHLVLPVFALALRPTAEVARLTSELLGEELPKDYIRVARAKGVPERWIITRHAFRNVVAAVVNAMSNSWSYVIGSLVIIERVFAWGGIGEALIDSVTFSQFGGSSFNPALVATLATTVALLFLLADLVTGLVSKALDPRLRRTRGAVA